MCSTCWLLASFWLLKVYFKYELLMFRIYQMRIFFIRGGQNILSMSVFTNNSNLLVEISIYLPLKEHHFSFLPSHNNPYHAFIITERTKMGHLCSAERTTHFYHDLHLSRSVPVKLDSWKNNRGIKFCLCKSQQTQLKYLLWVEDLAVTFKDVAIVVSFLITHWEQENANQ